MQGVPGGMPRGPLPSNLPNNPPNWGTPPLEASGRAPQPQPQSLSPEELQSQLPEWLRTQMGQADTSAQPAQGGPPLLPRFPTQPSSFGQTGQIGQPGDIIDQDVWPEPFPDLDGGLNSGGLPPRQR